MTQLLNRTHHKPLYLQIYDLIRDQINTGQLRAGDTIPSEREYADLFEVSRMTVRAAVNKLVQDGLLLRNQGKATVVASTTIQKSARGFKSFTEDMQSLGIVPSSRVLKMHSEMSSASVASQLNLKIGARVICLERLRLADEEPIALERCYLPHDTFPELLEHDLTQHSLYKTLEDRYGVRPVLAEETIEAVIVNQEEAELLQIEKGSPALLIRRLTKDARQQVIETVTTLYRADRYRVVLVRSR
ncbi:MAG: GntR family transcriptional regulator [Ardenticatenaceae bacterium]|nr:GntR family transcriptional regulator [Ardenticatenaceae bacterium]